MKRAWPRGWATNVDRLPVVVPKQGRAFRLAPTDRGRTSATTRREAYCDFRPPAFVVLRCAAGRRRGSLTDRPWHCGKRCCRKTPIDTTSTRLTRNCRRCAQAERAEKAAEPTPLNRVRFNLTGEVTLREGLGHLERALAGLGYTLSVDELALRAVGVDFEREFSLKLPAGRLKDVNRPFFRPAELRMVRKDNLISLVPMSTPAAAAVR